MSKFNLFVTFDGAFNKKVQKNNYIAGQDLAEYLAKRLEEQSFIINSIENIEYAFLIKCLSGKIEYEIMVSLDSIYNRYWEITFKPRYGFIQKLFGKNEDEELGYLLKSVNDILEKDNSIFDIRWYKYYGDQNVIKNKKYSTNPLE